MIKNPKGMLVQSLVFDREEFTTREASAWAVGHGFGDHASKPHVMEDTIRIRLFDPEDFKHDSFRTIEMHPGVHAIVAKPLHALHENPRILGKRQGDHYEYRPTTASGSRPRLKIPADSVLAQDALSVQARLEDMRRAGHYVAKKDNDLSGEEAMEQLQESGQWFATPAIEQKSELPTRKELDDDSFIDVMSHGGKQFKAKLKHGALLNLPIDWHNKGKNWLATIDIDPKAPGGLARDFVRQAQGNTFFYVDDADLLREGVAIEFGTKARNIDDRWYGVLIERDEEYLLFREYSSGVKAVEAAEEMQSKPRYSKILQKQGQVYKR